MCQKAVKGKYSEILISPVIGNGLLVNRIEQLIFYSRNEGKVSPQECAEYFYVIFKKNGESIEDKGKTLNVTESLKILENTVLLFESSRLVSLQRMGIY